MNLRLTVCICELSVQHDSVSLIKPISTSWDNRQSPTICCAEIPVTDPEEKPGTQAQNESENHAGARVVPAN